MTAAPQSLIPNRPPASGNTFKASRRPIYAERSQGTHKLAHFPSSRVPARIELAPTAPRRAPLHSPPLRLATPSRRASAAPNTTVRRLPQPKSSPSWLKLILLLQRSSGGVALLLGAALLAVYGWTAYIQQAWGQDYQSLQALQRQERQLSVANEILSSQMAQAAESPNSGLVLPQAGEAIFLEASPAQSPLPAQAAPLPQDLPLLPVNPPQGY